MSHFAAGSASDFEISQSVGPETLAIAFNQICADAVDTAHKLTSERAPRKVWPAGDH
jgi:hypothetical protein